jgi:hypothetical protein
MIDASQVRVAGSFAKHARTGLFALGMGVAGRLAMFSAPHRLRFTSALTVAMIATATLAAPRAYAQDLPPSQPPPASARAPNGEWLTPLQQTTQQTYVPQSVALSGPQTISDYDADRPVPPGYHAEAQVRKGLIIGGGATFGALYMLSVLTGASTNDKRKLDPDREDGTFLFIPVVGPFLQMTKTKGDTTAVTNAAFAIDGIAQAAGLTMLVLGITSRRTILVRNDLAEVHVLPMTVGSGGGMGLVGAF